MNLRVIVFFLLVILTSAKGDIFFESRRVGEFFILEPRTTSDYFVWSQCGKILSYFGGKEILDSSALRLGLQPKHQHSFKSLDTTATGLLGRFLENPDDAIGRERLAAYLQSKSDPRGELLRIAGELAQQNLSSERRDILEKREREIFRNHLPEIAPPELLALAYGDHFGVGLRFRDGFLAHLEMSPGGFVGYGRQLASHLASTIDGLSIRTTSEAPPTLQEIVATPWLTQLRSLQLSGYYSDRGGFSSGDLLKLLRNDKLKNLQKFELDPMSPQLFQEMVYAGGVLHSGIRTLTLRRELGVPVIYREPGQDHTYLYIKKPQEFSYYDWPFLVNNLRSKFPELSMLRIPQHGLNDQEQNAIQQQAGTAGFDVTFLP